MDPHLRYSQVRMGHNNNEGSCSGIIETKDFYYYLDAVRILEKEGFLGEGDLKGLKEWLGAFLAWLVESPQGREEVKRRNNRGVLYDLQVGAIAAYLKDFETLSEVVRRSQGRIHDHFEPDGRQPHELARTESAHYCAFNLQSWVNLADFLGRCGVDLWGYESAGGRSIRKGLEWLLPFFAGQRWPHPQLSEFNWQRLAPLFLAMPGGLDFPGHADFPGPLDVATCFHPHDGIKPYWQLGLELQVSGGGEKQPENKRRAEAAAIIVKNASAGAELVASSRHRKNERFMRFLAFGADFELDGVNAWVEWFAESKEKHDPLKGAVIGEDVQYQEALTTLRGLLESIVVSAFSKAGGKPVTMGISAGFDARTVLALAGQNARRLKCFTYGQPGNLDYDFSRLPVERTGVEHVLVNTAEAEWSLDAYEATVGGFQDYPLSPRVLAATLLNQCHGSRYEIHGHLNGVLTGPVIRGKSSEIWEHAVEAFTAKNDTFAFNGLLGSGYVRTLLPRRPFMESQRLGFDRQLDLGIRQSHRIRPVDSPATTYLLPYEDPRWVGFWLGRNMAGAELEGLFMDFIQTLSKEVFIEFDRPHADRASARQRRFELTYGPSWQKVIKGPMAAGSGSLRAPCHPTMHFCLSACYANNPSFRKMVDTSIERLKKRGIFREAAIDSAMTGLGRFDRNAGRRVNGFVSCDILLETGILDSSASRRGRLGQ